VGHRKSVADSTAAHLAEKAARFHSFKHTLLVPAMKQLWDVLLAVNENKLRNGCRNAWQTILL
jgi:hypothetical protein